MVSAAPVAGKVADSNRAEDRLSPATFTEPPLNARPRTFWDWLNAVMTQEQITRDLEAMKQVGMRGGEIWDVAAALLLRPESTRLIVHAMVKFLFS